MYIQESIRQSRPASTKKTPSCCHLLDTKEITRKPATRRLCNHGHHVTGRISLDTNGIATWVLPRAGLRHFGEQKNILPPLVIESLLLGCLVHCLITILTRHFSLRLILMQDLAFDTTIIRHQELETPGQHVTRLRAGQPGNLDSFAGRSN